MNATGGRPNRPEFLISVVDGNLKIRATSLFPFQDLIKPEPIDQFLNPEFISRLAAKLWDGDNDASVSKALTLIKGCADELAKRKSPLSDIGLSRPLPGNARFWKRISLESVIEIAVSVGRSSRSQDAVERAFSIIENARTTLEKRSEASDAQSNLVTKSDAAPLPRNVASGFAEASKPHWAWKEAVKRITGTRRLDRAEKAFLRFLTHPSICNTTSSSDQDLKRAIAGQKKHGFTLNEVWVLEKGFKNWHNEWVKSRQRESGKRIGKKNLRQKSV